MLFFFICTLSVFKYFTFKLELLIRIDAEDLIT